MRRLIACPVIIACLVFGTGQAQAQLGAIVLQAPRSVGWHLGDVLDLAVVVPVEAGYELQQATLPDTGPLNYWLELREVGTQVRRDGGYDIYRIALQYQTFYVALEARQRRIPGFMLRFAKEGRTIEAQVPPWTFTMSPLREIGRGQGSMALRPDAAAAPALQRPGIVDVALAGGASLLLAALLAWHYAVWPFRRRRARPFARAYRQLRRYDGRKEGYPRALIALHRAFDAAAGRRLMASDIPAFLQARPAMAPCGREIERFFAASRSQFFADPRGQALTAPELLQLARALAAGERQGGDGG